MRRAPGRGPRSLRPGCGRPGELRAGAAGPVRSASRLLASGLLVGLLVAGCDDASDAVGPGPVGEGQVTGVVARQKTAEGVPGVVMALLRGGGVRQVTVTGADGTFAFQGLEAGTWRVRPAATELAGLDGRYDAMEPVEHEVTLGSEPVDLVFAVVGLVPPRITGRVTCGGAGDPGAVIRVVGGATDASTVADASGLYSVLELDPGIYAVLAQGAACELSPAFQVVELRAGQLGEAHFQGPAPTGSDSGAALGPHGGGAP